MVTEGYETMLRYVMDIPRQLGQMLDRHHEVDILPRYRFRNILFVGMGGSAMGGDIAVSVLQRDVSCPMAVCRDYRLPGWAGPDTMLFAVSYSGNTEEALAAYGEAIRRRCRIVCISSGGQLTDSARRRGHPLFTVPDGLPPRAAIGYLTVPLLLMLGRQGVYPKVETEIEEAAQLLRELRDPWLGKSRRLASRLRGRLPFLYATSSLTAAAATRWRCQLNENSKVVCHASILPEHNHNEIVGMGSPSFLRRKTAAIFLTDRDTHERTSARVHITRSLARDLFEHVVLLEGRGRGRFARLMSLVMLGDLVSVELARLQGVDPLPVQRIDELKNRMASRR